MTSVKELCSSASKQVDSYFNQIETTHEALLQQLRAENAFLRAELARFARTNSHAGHADSEKNPLTQSSEAAWIPMYQATLPAYPRATPPLNVRRSLTSPRSTGISPRVALTTPRVTTPRSSPCMATLPVPVTTPRLRFYPSHILMANHGNDVEDVDDDSAARVAGNLYKQHSTLSNTFSSSEDTKMKSRQLTSLTTDLTGPVLNWFRLVAPMCSMFLLSVRRSEYETSLLLRPAWEAMHRRGSEVSSHSWLDSLRSPVMSKRSSVAELEAGESSVSYCVFHPDSRFIMGWSIVGVILILYDVLTFPLAGFDLEESQYQTILIWVSAIFWAADMILSCFRGVHHNGAVERRHWKIISLYARSWFILDFGMVSIDWSLIYLTLVMDANVAGAGKILRSGKVVRVTRMVRALILLRAIKIFQLFREFFENVRSDYLQLFIKLGVSIVVIILLNHYITCAWYAQAYYNNSDTHTWITVFLGVDPRPSFATEYFTATHFSLTQIAGSQEIVPQNARERLVASLIIVFDIIVLSVLVGTITDIFAQFRCFTLERSREVALIRKFCHRTSMRPSIEHRIWLFFRRHHRREQRLVLEADIDFFRHLPSSLKMDLHEHLYLPVLLFHPLFRCLLDCDRFSILAICSSAVTTIAPPIETEVFYEGDKAKCMFLVKSGSLLYNIQQIGLERLVQGDMWIAEVVLWTNWMHCGRLIAETQCELLTVHAETFEKTMVERAGTSEYFRCLRKYAALFAQRMSDSFGTRYVITDIDGNMNNEIDELVEEAFCGFKKPEVHEEDKEDGHAKTTLLNLGGFVSDFMHLKNLSRGMSLSRILTRSNTSLSDLNNARRHGNNSKCDRLEFGDASTT